MTTSGGSTRDVTVSLPDDVAAAIQALVDAGAASSVASYVEAATMRVLARDESLKIWRSHTGGPPPDDLRRRAQAALGIRQEPQRRAS